MSGSRKKLSEGSQTLTTFFFFFPFLVAEGSEDLNTTTSGLSSACQRNAIEMAFHRHADDGPTLIAL